jgi:hypothetical protein
MVGSKSIKDLSADQTRIERIERRLSPVETQWPVRSHRELLAQRRAHLFQPLQGAEDLRLIVGEMADSNVGVAEFP